MYVQSLLFDNKPDFYFVSCTLNAYWFVSCLVSPTAAIPASVGWEKETPHRAPGAKETAQPPTVSWSQFAEASMVL